MESGSERRSFDFFCRYFLVFSIPLPGLDWFFKLRVMSLQLDMLSLLWELYMKVLKLGREKSQVFLLCSSMEKLLAAWLSLFKRSKNSC